MLILTPGSAGHAHFSRRGMGRWGICPVADAGTEHVQWPGGAARDMSIGRAGHRGACSLFATAVRNMLIFRAEEWPDSLYVQWPAPARDMSSGRAGQRGACPLVVLGTAGHAHSCRASAGTCSLFAPTNGRIGCLSTGRRGHGTCPVAAGASAGHVHWSARPRSMSSGRARVRARPVTRLGKPNGPGPVQTTRVGTGAQVACPVRRSKGRLRCRRHGFHCE
ncbi:hypothetical protein NKCBBBOE_00251 [Pseudarthrobacter sp. MM222]|nr:hypothetical protein NKCBBBOE_00251 [Pseudarthrobacter sp. MM222]